MFCLSIFHYAFYFFRVSKKFARFRKQLLRNSKRGQPRRGQRRKFDDVENHQNTQREITNRQTKRRLEEAQQERHSGQVVLHVRLSARNGPADVFSVPPR